MIKLDAFDELLALAPTPDGVEPCGCDESLALRRAIAATRADRLDPGSATDGTRRLCPACGVRPARRGVDIDGTCAACGADTCEIAALGAHLAAVGLRIARARAEPADARRRAVSSAWGGGHGVD
jgi:hypothetical protein